MAVPLIVLEAAGLLEVGKKKTPRPAKVFADEAEAIRLANYSPYGLSGSVWSSDLDRAKRVARQIETGSVSINNVLATVGNSALPFGGTKHSGFGRYKGALGLYSFCNVKSIMIEGGRQDSDLNWYPYSREKYALFSRLIERAYSGGPFATLKAMLVGLRLQALAKKSKL